MSYYAQAKSHPLDAAALRTFMFQGKALFTLENKEKGSYITFKVKSPKRKRGTPEDLTIFDIEAKVLNDGYGGMVYIGRLNRKTREFKKGFKVQPDNVGLLTLQWLLGNWNNLERYEESGKLGMYHLGICCKCGMPLTVPESIENGIGPQCKRYRESNSIKLMEELGIITKGKKYDDLVIEAIETFPYLIEKLFIPDTVRRRSDWVNQMQSVSDWGFFS